MRILASKIHVSTEPATEPVTLQEAKDFLRVSDTDEDSLITSLIIAARQVLEKWTGRAFIEQTRVATYKELRTEEKIFLPYPQVISVDSVTYLDEDEASQTLATSEYEVIAGDAGAVWFNDLPGTADHPEAITITYKAGYGSLAADVPDAIKTVIKLVVADWFENRPGREKDIPEWILSLVATYRVPIL